MSNVQYIVESRMDVLNMPSVSSMTAEIFECILRKLRRNWMLFFDDDFTAD
jgi:hypothetical protein